MEITKPSPQWADNSQFQMIDVGAKAPTHRRAEAQGRIHLSEAAYEALKKGTNPKGNVLALAEMAGIMTAKKTSDLLPLCHPLPLEKVRLRFQLEDQTHSVTVFCEASTTAKTGVEMEALSGVNGALLCIYDLSKAIDPVITLSEIRLNLKEGGKSGVWTHPQFAPPGEAVDFGKKRSSPILEGIRSAVITISDRASQGIREDASGPAAVQVLSQLGSSVGMTELVPDEKNEIQRAVLRAVQESGANLVVTTGGTGLGPRDTTPEALQEILDQIIPGFGECLRKTGSQHTQMAWLSRSFAGRLGRSLVVALPGSRKAVLEGLDSIQNLIPHSLQMIQGGDHG